MKYSIFLILACLFSQTAWAGWVVTYKDAESGEKSQEFYDGRKHSTGELIYTDKYFVAIDRNSKSYWKGTPEQFCKDMDEFRKMMEAQMASMPPEYRPVPMDKRNVMQKKLGSKSIAGFNAKGYVFFADGIQRGEVWVSSDPGLSGIINFEKSLDSSAKDMSCFDNMASDSLDGASLYKKTVENQFILKEPGRQVVSVEKKVVSPAHFNVPSGYKSFNDYQKFMNHIGNASNSSSDAYYEQTEPSYDESENRLQAATSKSKNKSDNVIVKDAKDISEGAVDEAHREMKDGIQKEISDDIKKGVKGLLDSFF